MGCCQGLHPLQQEISQEIGVKIVPQQIEHAPQEVSEIQIIQAQLRQQSNTSQTCQKVSIRRGKFISLISGAVEQQYILTEQLGQGGFAQVFKAIQNGSEIQRAIKIINKQKLQPKQRRRMRRELSIMRQLNHPNVINVIQTFEDANFISHVTELCTGGDLLENIIKCEGFNENTAAKYMYQIMSAVKYVHSNKIIHRDIKPENILLTSEQEDPHLVLIDFGISIRIKPRRKVKTCTGSCFYMAPEVIQGRYDQKCDIWSCGVLLYMMIGGIPPFYGNSAREVFKMIVSKMPSFSDEEWLEVSKECKSLINWMLNKNPEQRPDADQVLNHPWIQKGKDNRNSNSPIKSTGKLVSFRAWCKLQQATLLYISAQLTSRKETEQLARIFLEIDQNGDGLLSREEITEGYRKLDQLHLPNLDEIFQACDADKSGYIDYNEFITATMNWKQTLNDQKLTAAFQAFDKDGNGVITVDELKMFLGGGGKEQDHIWEAIMKEADANGDGEIDFHEFKEIITRNIK